VENLIVLGLKWPCPDHPFQQSFQFLGFEKSSFSEIMVKHAAASSGHVFQSGQLFEAV
jgi:hypothetical protein